MSRATEFPTSFESLLALHEAAYGRADHESRLVRALRDGHPAYREELHASLTDEDSGEPLAAALVLPRRIVFRGVAIPVGVLAPWGVSPARRQQGLGRAVVDLAAKRARECGLLALATIGDPRFLRPLGFGSAFDLHTVHATTERLPEPGSPEDWRGLIGEDLPQLPALHLAARAGVSGVECRDACVPDFEAQARDSYALVHAPEGRVLAYVRFRVREELEVSECSAADAAGVEACLALFARLAAEHGRMSVLVHASPTQPIALALAARGCIQERSRFDGASQLRVLDWPALFAATEGWWRPALGDVALTLAIDDRIVALDDGAPRYVDAPAAAHLALPTGWAQGLLSGQRSARELRFATKATRELEESVDHRLDALFAPTPASWSYAPAYELADE